MTIYCEFWCSPLRQEIYSQKFISAETFDTPVIDEIKENYVDTFGDFWSDVFGDAYSETGGLFKVLCKISVNWKLSYDWEGCPDYDVQFEIEVLGSNKCGSFAELKCTWLELTGRSDKYNDRAIDLYFEGIC